MKSEATIDTVVHHPAIDKGNTEQAAGDAADAADAEDGDGGKDTPASNATALSSIQPPSVIYNMDRIDFAVNGNGFKVINQLQNYPNFPKLCDQTLKTYKDEDRQTAEDLAAICYLCDKTRGPKIGCDFGNCPVRFHQTCGIV